MIPTWHRLGQHVSAASSHVWRLLVGSVAGGREEGHWDDDEYEESAAFDKGQAAAAQVPLCDDCLFALCGMHVCHRPPMRLQPREWLRWRRKLIELRGGFGASQRTRQRVGRATRSLLRLRFSASSWRHCSVAWYSKWHRRRPSLRTHTGVVRKP